jgi:hypothetical protein
MEYVLFINENTDSSATDEEWELFFKEANESGMFNGGSEIRYSCLLGNKPSPKVSDNIGGFMRFESKEKQQLLKLLEKHPVYVHGGTLELCEMPKS